MAEDGMGRLRRQQAALTTFGSYAFREPNLYNILTEAARACAESLGVPYCKICRYRSATNDLLIEAGYGWKAGIINEVVSQADESSPQGRAYVTGRPVIINDVRTAKHFKLAALYEAHGIISTIDVIIKGKDGDPYGVLEIDSPTQTDYDDHDVTFLTGFANVLAEAVATHSRKAAMQVTIIEMAKIIAEKDTLAAEKDILLDERTILAEELKHRVRNNLQLIHSLLDTHLTLDSGAAETSSIHAIIRRVTTLAEVYEQLLGTGMGRTIDLADYLRALCESLPSLQSSIKAGITLRCEANRRLVSIDTVTAIGMVVAELVSNSYEHAYPTTPGDIFVRLHDAEAETAVLTVDDDGCGFVEAAGSKRHGVGLVRRLVEQVRGTIELATVGGTHWSIHFPAPLPASRMG